MRIKLLFFIASCFLFQTAFSQTLIRGKVISDEDQLPVIGASVVVKGTTIGSITNYDGDFSLEVPEEHKLLVISYVGMLTQEALAKNGMRVVLKPDVQNIDEVIVVAYGTTKRSSFTGSAANIGKDKIQKLQVSEISKALEGAIPGVQIASSSGQPGSSASIRIRGVGSISASSSPLIVLDGVPYEGSLNSIPSQDIESMSVLKDAAANSLYGARGANGVIMITTKKGVGGKLEINFENRTGFNYKGLGTYDRIESSKEYYELFWESLRNQQVFQAKKDYVTAGQYASQNLVPVLGGYNSFNVSDTELVDPITGLLNPSAQLLYQDDWYDEAFGLGFRQENNFSLSGGTDKATYYFSLGFLKDDSYTDNSDLTRYSARARIDQQITDWWRMGLNLSAISTKSNVPSVGTTALNSIFYTGLLAAPILPVYRRDKNGNYLRDSNGNKLYDYGVTEGHSRPFAANSNPIAEQAKNIRESKRDVLNGKLYLELQLYKGLRFTSNLSIDNFNANSIDFQTPTGGMALSVNGRSTKTFTRLTSVNFNQLINYNYNWGKHEIEALLGHETKSDKGSSLSASKTNFYLPSNPELDNAVITEGATSYTDSYSLEGYFSQVKYNWADKYYLSGSYRLDGSSRFHPDARWGSFWSVGSSWRITQEPFMQSLSFINDLKLKASFGTQGNDNLGNLLPYMNQSAVVASSDGSPATITIFRGNPDITWEKSNNFNVGVEFQLWNRLSGSIEYFYKQTWDLLYAKPLPPSQGSPSTIWRNTMKMYNSGIEVDLSYNLFKRNDFQWNVNLNLTHYKNELQELPSDFSSTGSWINGSKLFRKGASIYNWYGYKYAGVNPENGAALYYADVLDEQNHKIGVTTVENPEEATQYEFDKESIPDVYGGFGTMLQYKGFDLSLSFAYQIGGWVMDSQYQSMMNPGDAGVNWHKDIYKRWTVSNRNTNIPRLEEGYKEGNAESDRFLEKASYLNLRNVTIGYTLQVQRLKDWGIDQIRFYVVGDNLFLLSARKGFDPRQSFGGNTGYSYDAMSTCSFGFNINF